MRAKTDRQTCEGGDSVNNASDDDDDDVDDDDYDVDDDDDGDDNVDDDNIHFGTVYTHGVQGFLF